MRDAASTLAAHDRPSDLPGQMSLPGIDPEIPKTANKAFQGAWRKGRQAAIDGRSLSDCPYPDKRAGCNGHIVTFSRAFRRWWRDGFESIGLFPGVADGREATPS